MAEDDLPQQRSTDTTTEQPPTTYRTTPNEPGEQDAPREVLGRFAAPLLGDVDVELGLGRSIHLELDREALSVRPGSGLVARAEELPTVALRRLDVDLVQGVVRSDADGLGAFFDRVLTVALCSALRQTLGWKPGASLADHAARRFTKPQRGGAWPVWTRRSFPRAGLAVHPQTRLALDLSGQGVELTLTRPALLRFLGIGLKIVMVRFLFASGKLELKTAQVGPLRRGLLALVAYLANRWLRPRLPAAMTVPGYDLFADEGRRGHVEELIRRLRGRKRDERGEAGMGARAGASPHDLARAGDGDRAGFAGVVSLTKAAVFAALQTLRVSADDMPALTRSLFKIPLGPFSAVALCTDRAGEVALIKHPGGGRLEAPLGLYLFADQFPELAELRVIRISVGLGAPERVSLDVQTEPPLGPLLNALLQRAAGRHLLPRVPTQRLRDGGLFAAEDAREHVLWRHGLADGRHVLAHTDLGAEVSLRHQEDGLVLEAPAGLRLGFEGLPLPPARLHRVVYRWADGSLEVDGETALGEFGQALLSQIVRVHVAPRAPHGLGLHALGGPGLDPAIERDHRSTLVDLRIPVLGRLQLRMDPSDTLSCDVAPDQIHAHCGRGVALVLHDMKLAMTITSARYALPDRRLTIESTPEPGAYVEALAALVIENLAMPLLRKLLPMWPDATPDATWDLAPALRSSLADLLGVAMKISIPAGGALTLRRAPDALELGATEPLQVVPEDVGLLADFAVSRIRWQPAGERVALQTQPPAGPLAHELARRIHAGLTPDVINRTIAEHLALPKAFSPPPPPPAPTSLALFELSPPLLGSFAVFADTSRALAVSLRREAADLRFGAGVILRADKLGIQLELRRVSVSFLPFTVQLETAPAAGELENHLVTSALRRLFARFMGLFWPSDRAHRPEGEVLLAFGREQPWGPIELCVGPGGAVDLHLDHEGLQIHSEAGVFIGGEALGWLPRFRVNLLAYRFSDGAVQLQISGLDDEQTSSLPPVGPLTESIVAHLTQLLLAPHLPAWTQRLGMRVLPPPPMLAPDLSRVAVWRAQLPGGYAQVQLMMDPRDLLQVRASRTELSVASALGLQVEVPGLRMRVPFSSARYFMQTGEVRVSGLGLLENALAAAVLRHELTRLDPTAAEPGDITVADVLDRFPIDDKGRRELFKDKLVRVLLDPDTAIVATVEETGLRVVADPGLKLDGIAGLDYLFGGLHYSFADAAFHLDIQRDGLLGGVFKGLVTGEVEGVLNSLLRPLLPRAMRTPGYSLARDPEPSATLAALVRTVSLGKLARFTAT